MASPRVFLLPKNNSESPFTIVTLPHPRTSVPTRFLLHPETGLHELTKITSTASTPRSWLLTTPTPTTPKPEPENSDSGEESKGGNKETRKTPSDWLGNGQTIQDGHLYISTPIDPLFILLPRLLPIDAPKAHFLPLDDILDIFTPDEDDEEDVENKPTPAHKPHWEAVLKPTSAARLQIESRIRAICDTVDVGGDSAYKPSQPKILAILAQKCDAMVKGGLPKSMEDAFVSKVLAKPVSMQVVAAEPAEGGKEKDGVLPTPPESQEEWKEGKEEELVRHLLRVRVAIQFLTGTYLAANVATALVAHMATVYDFGPLDACLDGLKKARSELASLRSADFSVGRGNGGDGGESKRRKKEEEEEREEEEKKKKKNVSKGVKDLKKVNTKGMAKMTSFFKKKNA